MRLVGVLALVAGCSFRSPSGAAGDDATDARPGDASPGVSFVPLHVPAGGRAAGTGDLDLQALVDTGALTIDGASALPAGVVFDAWPQPGGVDLAVLHVRRLRVPPGATVRVRGSRALVVVASDAIEIDGVLDGSAQHDQPGPGGAAPGAGSGAGRTGGNVGTFRDSGGSGGGFGAAGGAGGAAGGVGCQTLPGASAGVAYGDSTLTVLVAGSGGGAASASSCGNRPPGAGGGAIQLSAAVRVRVAGGINVGGGGGGGGRAQQVGASACDMSAGAGGGSGGAIVLQSPILQVSGTLAANGGGGGSSGGDPDGNDLPPEADGENGEDGLLATDAADGGDDVGVWGSAGGPGGTTGAGGPGLSDTNCEANGGGGGGAAGRIVVAHPACRTPSLGGPSSPPSVLTTY